MPVTARGPQGGEGGFPLRVGSVVQGVGLTLAAALALASAIGLAIAWTPAWDAADGLLQGLHWAAMAVGGWWAGRTAPRLGWLHGGLTGLVYGLVVMWLVAPEGRVGLGLPTGGLTPLLYGCLAGAAGGVLGALTKK